MSQQQNIVIAQKLLEGIGGGLDPHEIAALFDADLVFEIQGDDGCSPGSAAGTVAGRSSISSEIFAR
jgi:hypothetical protein